MMLKVLPLTALVLGLSSGVALADRDHSRNGRNDHHSSAVVRDHRGNSNWNRGNSNRGNNGHNVVIRDRGNWNRGNNVVIRDRGNWNHGSRVVIRNGPRYHQQIVRRPIFVSRPVIRHRYFNYYQPPQLIVENYNSMPGYYWVRGQWTWDGQEWIWQPGHYEPDASYVDPSYGPTYGYDNGY